MRRCGKNRKDKRNEKFKSEVYKDFDKKEGDKNGDEGVKTN